MNSTNQHGVHSPFCVSFSYNLFLHASGNQKHIAQYREIEKSALPEIEGSKPSKTKLGKKPEATPKSHCLF